MPNKVINFELDILPASDSTFNLGNAEKRWLINGRDVSEASERDVDTSIEDGSQSQGLPTSQAVAEFVEGKGYKSTDATTEESGLMSAADKIKLNGINGQTILYIKGPNTDAAGLWTGTSNDITEYYNGLIIIYEPFISGGQYSTTLNINNLGARPCYINTEQRLTTQYGAGTPILFIYASNRWQAVHINVETYAKMAEGYAVGKQDGSTVTTGSPYYENNAKYYAEIAGESADLATDMAARSGYMNFYIDENNHLIYQHTESVDVEFSLVEGRLIASWQTE